jgi:hypothetical protein
MIDVLSLGWASLMLVLFSLALVVWGRNGFNKSFQSSKEIKLNEINFNKKYGRNRHCINLLCNHSFRISFRICILQVQSNTFYWENQRITNKYQTSEKRMPLDSSLNLFLAEMEL